MGEKYLVWDYEAEFEFLKLFHLELSYEFNLAQ